MRNLFDCDQYETLFHFLPTYFYNLEKKYFFKDAFIASKYNHLDVLQ